MRTLLLFVAATAAAAEAPRAIDPTARYATMLDESPFALATVVEAPKEPTESFAANWELTGLAKLRDDKGVEKDFVTIRSRDRRVSFSLTGDEVSEDEDAKGVSIHSVDWQESSRKSTVTLKRGGELAKVEFGQETAPAAPPPNNAQLQNPNIARGVQPLPGAVRTNPVGPGFNPNAAGVPRPPLQQNGLVIPGAPPVTNLPQPAQNTAAPTVADPRKRVRVINSRP